MMEWKSRTAGRGNQQKCDGFFPFVADDDGFGWFRLLKVQF